MTAQASIHFRRRWFYVLWSGLLVLSLAALYLWRTPVAVGDWTLRLKVRLEEPKAPVQVRIWFGPERLVREKSLDSTWNRRIDTLPTGRMHTLQDLQIPLLRRRWTKHPFPGLNGEVLVLTFVQEGQPHRYLAIPLKEDLWMMLLRHKRVTGLEVVTQWSDLPLEPLL